MIASKKPDSHTVVHVSPQVQAQGGMERLHEYHRDVPGRQIFIALFDRQPQPRGNYVNLDCGWATTLREMRRRFRAAIEPYAGAMVIYHNAWGLSLFHDLDGAARRLVYLHSDRHTHASMIPALSGLIDGLFVVAPSLAETWRELPSLSADRVALMRAPIDSPPEHSLQRSKANGPVVLGYAGRLVRARKRVDRLPKLVKLLEERGFQFEFEIMGEGPMRNQLQRRLGHKVRFHGWVPREAIWEVLSRWDAAVFFSEMEGGPIAMFEGMRLGVIPFFPKTSGAWGDIYAEQVDRRCHYPAGDMIALANAIMSVFVADEREQAPLRERARELVLDHTRQNYEAALVAFLGHLCTQPRVSLARHRKPRLTDRLPLGLVTRIVPWALRLS